jgi:hypothetical protein
VTRSSLNWVLGGVLAGLLLVASCSQGGGDTCQVDGDCSSGLACCRGSAADAQRGYCATKSACATGSVAADPDSGLRDAGADAASFDDAGSDTDSGSLATDSGQDASSMEDSGGG